jgi:diguanylate cyclase (GGDEF)-like protein
VAEQLRARIEAEQFDVGDGRRIQVTASLGVAQWQSGERSTLLLERADSRLYRAKHLGRNRVVTT